MSSAQAAAAAAVSWTNPISEAFGAAHTMEYWYNRDRKNDFIKINPFQRIKVPDENLTKKIDAFFANAPPDKFSDEFSFNVAYIAGQIRSAEKTFRLLYKNDGILDTPENGKISLLNPKFAFIFESSKTKSSFEVIARVTQYADKPVTKSARETDILLQDLFKTQEAISALDAVTKNFSIENYKKHFIAKYVEARLLRWYELFSSQNDTALEKFLHIGPFDKSLNHGFRDDTVKYILLRLIGLPIYIE
jgi:hypothetical protein